MSNITFSPAIYTRNNDRLAVQSVVDKIDKFIRDDRGIFQKSRVANLTTITIYLPQTLKNQQPATYTGTTLKFTLADGTVVDAYHTTSQLAYMYSLLNLIKRGNGNVSWKIVYQ